jgi:hypothetical protein
MQRRYDASLVSDPNAASGDATDSSTGATSASSDPNRVNLDLVDLLYAVPVAALATRVGETELEHISAAAWADIILALVALTLGWVGHHTNRWRRQKEAPDPERLHERPFTEGSFWQFWIEVFVIGVYFALTTRLSLPGHSRVHTLHWKGSWIVVLFLLYLIWDGADIWISFMRAKAAEKDEPGAGKQYKRWRERATHGALVTFLFLLVFFAVRLCAPAGSYSTVWFDATCILLLYLYRVAQQLWIHAFWGISWDKDPPHGGLARPLVLAGVAVLLIAVGVLAVTGVLHELFTHRREPMVIDRLKPARGPTTGGTSVGVTGEFFEPGSATRFRVGTQRATSARCPSTTSCTFVTPPGPAGKAQVIALLRGGRAKSSTKKPHAFTYVAPAREAVRVELTARGRRVLRRQLGAGCRADDLDGRLLGGPSSAPLVLAFATGECHRLLMHLPRTFGAVYAAVPIR